MVWNLVFFKDNAGNEPAKEFICQEPYGARAEIIHVFDLLHRFGLNLGKPYVEKVQGKIWALRVKHSSDYYRIFYFADSDQEFVLFHAIKKKADKFTKQDIKIAMKRMNEHLAGIS